MSLSIGVDLGQVRDKTAIVALSTFDALPEIDEDEESPRRRRPRRQRHFAVLHIATLRPGLAYVEQVRQITAIAELVGDEERPHLWVDQTGVGRPIVDMLRDVCPYSVHGVTATSGAEIVRHGRDVSVPKATLIGALEVAMSTGRVHCADDLALAGELRKELAAFAFELSDTGRPTFGGKGAHDDIVSALALAVFGAERGTTATFREFMGEEIANREGREAS
jgi:hypothetical protein